MLAVSAFRMKALHDAVGPDFAYSSSYMSLLSAAGTMTGIFCCGIPGLRAIVVRRQRERDLTIQTAEDGGGGGHGQARRVGRSRGQVCG